MKINSHHWNLALTPLYGKASGNGENEETPQARRLRETKEALQRLQSMPGARESAKQLALARVEQLKKRIEQLRALLASATPEQAKALARQIAVVAKELAGLARQAGSSGNAASSSTTASLNPEVVATPTLAGTTGNASTPSAQGTDTSGTTTAETGNDKPASVPLAATGNTSARTSGDSDKDLRASLQEAAKKLKSLIELLKTKLRAHDKQSQDEVHQAERALHELASTLDGHELHSVLSTATAPALSTGTAEPAISGSIDVHA